jgi:glutaredoxin-related protein
MNQMEVCLADSSQTHLAKWPAILSTYSISGVFMARPILEERYIHPAIRSAVAEHQQAIVQEVMAAVRDNAVVVVGMGMNPFPKLACKALDKINQPYKYLEYGNYFNTWRKRNALKMWTGWPTFPMVFVKGTLVGGTKDLKAMIASGEIKNILE